MYPPGCYARQYQWITSVYNALGKSCAGDTTRFHARSKQNVNFYGDCDGPMGACTPPAPSVDYRSVGCFQERSGSSFRVQLFGG